MTDETDLDLLIELTTLPHWRVLKRELREFTEGLEYEALRTSTTPMELIRKEAVTTAMAEIRRFFEGIEAEVEREVKRAKSTE